MPRLDFLDRHLLDAIPATYLPADLRSLYIAPLNDKGRDIATGLVKQFPGLTLLSDDSGKGTDLPIKEALPTEGDAALLLHDDADALSTALLAQLDRRHGAVIAPKTGHHFQQRPLFLISVPKAGTHLLFELMDAFGYQRGVIAGDRLNNGYWYNVEFSNSHTRASDFFIDSVRRSPFGNRHHAFPRTPAVLMYRNPLDILVSEANYYHKDSRTLFSEYFDGMYFDDRIRLLLDDPWLLGNFRNRMAGFVPWFRLPNVLPVSFEELVGQSGGGFADEQRAAIWSLQLRLHVPGDPEVFATQIINPQAPTFAEGQIGSYRRQLSPELFEDFSRLPQDFMTAFGFDGSDLQHTVFPPKQAAEYRQRPLRLRKQTFDAVPIRIAVDFLGHDIVRYHNHYYAVPSGGPINRLDQCSAEQLETLLGAETESDLRAALIRIHDNATRYRRPRLLRSGVHGYNLVALEGGILAVARKAGDVDLRDAGTRKKLAEDRLLFTFHSEDEATEILRLRSENERLSAVAIHLLAATTNTLPPSSAVPKLLIENYKGFNLVAFGEEVFAISVAAGPTNLSDKATCEALRASNQLLVAPSLAAAFGAVDRLPATR